MFGIIDMAMVSGITFVGTALICMFIAGTLKLHNEEEAYQVGYDKGYADGCDYDVEKVVTELEEAGFNEAFCLIIPVDTAIAIVRNGGKE